MGSTDVTSNSTKNTSSTTVVFFSLQAFKMAEKSRFGVQILFQHDSRASLPFDTKICVRGVSSSPLSAEDGMTIASSVFPCQTTAPFSGFAGNQSQALEQRLCDQRENEIRSHETR